MDESPEVEVRPSAIEGLGIFARRGSAAGERIRRINVVREVTPEAPLGGGVTRGFAFLLCLCVLSPRASSHGGTRDRPALDPVSACAGIRDRLTAYFETANRAWDPDPWAYEDADTVAWRERKSGFPEVATRFTGPCPGVSGPNGGNDAEACSLTVWRRFRVDGDTVSFTMGRAPEFCSEAPRMIWRTRDLSRWQRALPPLFNWNVEALWCTEHYLVLGLEASYEDGEHDERLAFWHVLTGRVLLSPVIVWDGGGRTGEPDRYLPRRFPGWRTAAIAEIGAAVVLTRADTTVAFWPGDLQYAYRIGRPR